MVFSSFFNYIMLQKTVAIFPAFISMCVCDWCLLAAVLMCL